MKSPAQLFTSLKTKIFEKYGENPGKMLVHTGVAGWILSSLAQVSAVVFNEKISPEQKSFLIPQEMADAAVNILSFYVITSSFKNIASKLVSTGKITTKPIKDALKNLGHADKIGKFNFNIGNITEVQNEYKPFKNGVDVIASTAGSIISCNIVTPILRNQYASKKQKELLDKAKGNIQPVLPRTSMADFQRISANQYSSSLKI